MHAFALAIVVAASLLPAPAVFAQATVDPSGHWRGTLQAPGSPISFDVDLAKNAAGQLAGTVTIPSQHIDGLPLLKVAANGLSVTFQARSDQSFGGVVSADGQSISGEFSVAGGTVPFNLARAGEASIAAPVKSAAIPKALEGTWNGVLTVDASTLRLVLTMENQPDGTAVGRIVNVDRAGCRSPWRSGRTV